MNKRKWRKRARRCRKMRNVAIRTLDEWIDRCNVHSEREAAALNKAEELRQDNIRLATELARMQGVCLANLAQVQKHAATIVDLREHLVALQESDMLDLLENKRLLAWQRQVRAAMPADYGPITAGGIDYMYVAADDYEAMRQAIEGEP